MCQILIEDPAKKACEIASLWGFSKVWSVLAMEDINESQEIYGKKGLDQV